MDWEGCSRAVKSDQSPKQLLYFDQGLDLSNARWPSQHDGAGGFDPKTVLSLADCF